MSQNIMSILNKIKENRREELVALEYIKKIKPESEQVLLKGVKENENLYTNINTEIKK